jgi:hypothetical protein
MMEFRFRVYVDGQLVHEEWIQPDAPDADFHALVAAQNERIGAAERWLIEMFQPGVPEDEAYTRFGGDRDGVVEPHLVPDGDIARALGITLV